MDSEPRRHRLARSYAAQVAEALRGRGWKVAAGAPVEALGRPDLLAERSGRRYAVDIKVAPDSRRDMLRALLADAILCSRRHASALGAEPLAMVAAPHISASMAEALSQYVASVAPGQAFGLADSRGLIHFVGRDLDDDSASPRVGNHLMHQGEEGAFHGGSPGSLDYGNASSRYQNLFSDINQWLLKVLLGQLLPEKYISVPQGRFASPSDLAKAASVSAPSAYRFASLLSSQGFLERGPTGLRIVRIGELLSKWKAAVSVASKRQYPMAWLLPAGNSREQLEAALGGPDSAVLAGQVSLGLFAACDALNLGFVRGGPVHLYVRALSPSLLEALGLVPASAGRSSDVFVRVPRWRESLFRPRVQHDRIWGADVLQCWLDVSCELSRGAEQAELLWRRVLAPGLGLSEEPP